MRKKILSMFLVAAMAVGMLVGCGDTKQEASKQSSVSSESTSQAKSEEKSEVKEEPVTVTWLMAESEPKDLDMVLEDLNEKLVEKINVKLNMVCIESGEYNNRVNLASSSGEDFDIVFTSSWLNSFDENMAKGALLEISDLIDQYGQDIVANVLPALWDVTKVNGGIYAIPNQQTSVKQRAVFIQKEYADKYGWTKTSVEDHTEFEPFFDKVKEDLPADMFIFHNSNPPHADKTEALASVASIDVGVGIDEVKVYWDTEVFAQTVNRDWQEKGYFHPEVAVGGDMATPKKNNKFVAFGGSGFPYGDINVSNSQGKEYIMVTVGEPYMNVTSGKTTMLGINVNSKNPEAAVKLINLLWADAELFNELMFGLEGVHYNKVGEDRVEVIEGSDWNLYVNDWSYGNQFSRWKLPSEPDDIWDAIYEQNVTALVSPLRGFSADTSNLQVEIAQVSAVKKEYSKQLRYAESDAEYEKLREEYVKKMKDAGADTICEEIQKQVDEWIAANK